MAHAGTWEERMAQRAFAQRRAEYEAAGGKIYRSADEVWADDLDACRDCCEPREAPGTFYGWAMWAWTCGGPPGGCTHAHHDDEVALAAAQRI